MKKKHLIKPPVNDGEILFLSGPKEFLNSIREDSLVGVCHQPYFFNPGVSLKFLFLEGLAAGKKDFIFLDTDRVRIGAKAPFPDGSVGLLDFINSDQDLSEYPSPGAGIFDVFFSSLEDKLRPVFPASDELYSNLSRFREIVSRNAGRRYLKEILAESFVEFYGLKTGYSFLSDLLKGKEFEKFFTRVYRDAENFRNIHNTALDEFRKEYRFRYKNYPFPELEEKELPFWIVRDGKRVRCFEQDVGEAGTDGLKIFPRAATLTIFLRLYRVDLFIHGIGGANYEWIQDRIIERFFRKVPPPYAILSGTFHLGTQKEREFPYFLFDPRRIRRSLRSSFNTD